MANMPKSVEPTIWALRKKGLQDRASNTPSLFEHLYGYDPIRILGDLSADPTVREALRQKKVKVAAPLPNIINAETNFALVEIASDLPPDMT